MPKSLNDATDEFRTAFQIVNIPGSKSNLSAVQSNPSAQ